MASCLLFLVWFVSGLIMVYVPYPSLTKREALAGLPAIDWTKVRLGPSEAERIVGGGTPAKAIVLESIGTGPVWRVTPRDGRTVTLSAAGGAVLGPFTKAQAAQTATTFGGMPVTKVELVERDQWTVANGFDRHRPLYRARLAGSSGRDLYISSTTGAVVQETSSRERFWNWLGSVPHWIYPTLLRQNQTAWRQTVIWVAGPCVLVAITGMWIGILRTRLGKRRFKSGRMTPYRGWMLWHHISGLTGGALLTLWIFSGWLSVDPGRLFASPGIPDAAAAAYGGAGALPALSPQRLSAAAAGARRMEFAWAGGRPWMRVESGAEPRTLDARTLRPASRNAAELAARAKMLLPGARVTSVEYLRAPDLYWYETGALPRLPVLRVRFADDAGTWVHLDAASGELLGSIDRRGRAYRWVYELFHTWNLNVLTLHRPAWDVLLWAFSLAGIVTSASGIWIGWRRLRGRPPRSHARGRLRT